MCVLCPQSYQCPPLKPIPIRVLSFACSGKPPFRFCYGRSVSFGNGEQIKRVRCLFSACFAAIMQHHLRRRSLPLKLLCARLLHQKRARLLLQVRNPFEIKFFECGVCSEADSSYPQQGQHQDPKCWMMYLFRAVSHPPPPLKPKRREWNSADWRCMIEGKVENTATPLFAHTYICRVGRHSCCCCWCCCTHLNFRVKNCCSFERSLLGFFCFVLASSDPNITTAET